MRFVFCGAALSAVLLGAAVVVSDSNASGLSGLHEKARIGNKICMAGHLHYGQSGAWATREQAVAAAERSWGSFTALEYGDAWADYRLAASADMACETVSNDRGGILWSCKAKASPCQIDPVLASGMPRTPEPRGRVRQLVERARLSIHPGAHMAPLPPAHPTPREQLVWPGDRR